MVAVDLEPPRGVVGRRAEDRHPVEPLAELVWAAGEFRERLVQAHDVPGFLEPVLAEGGTEERERTVALLGRTLAETDAVTHHEAVDVAPATPRVVL